MVFHRGNGRKNAERVKSRCPFHPFQHGADCCGDGLALALALAGMNGSFTHSGDRCKGVAKRYPLWRHGVAEREATGTVELGKGQIRNPTLRRLERGRARAGSISPVCDHRSAGVLPPSWSRTSAKFSANLPAPWSSWAKGLHNPPTLALQEFVQPAHD